MGRRVSRCDHPDGASSVAAYPTGIRFHTARRGWADRSESADGLDALVQGVRTNAIESVMFPHDVIANAPRILSDLARSFFPPADGTFLIGPMARSAGVRLPYHASLSG